MSDRFDIVVVGGGMAGLGAAAFAARGGAQTLLLERAAQPGGRAVTQDKDGFLHNLGPHAVYGGGAGHAILGEVGVEVRGAAPNTIGYALVRGKRYRLPAGALSTITTRALGLRAKQELGHVLFSLRNLDTASLQSVTVKDWLAATFRQPRAADVLRTYLRVATYTNAPETQSAGAALDSLRLGLGGVIYADGGWGVLVDGVRQSALAAGATIECGARVTSVRPAGGQWSVTTASGDAYLASAVILTGGPDDCAGVLDGGARQTVAGWGAACIPVRAASLDIALQRLPNSRGRVAFSFDEPLYFSVHSAVARLAPEGRALVSLARYLAPSEKLDTGAIERQLLGMMDVVQPGWRPLEIHRRYLPSLTVSHAQVTAKAGGPGGRPGPAVPGAPGLFVAGDWVGPTGMLNDAALASGKAAGLAAAASARSAPALARTA